MKNPTLYENIQDILDESDKPVSNNTYKTYYDRLEWIRKNGKIVSNQPRAIIKDPAKIIDLVEDSQLKLSSKALTAVVLMQLAKKTNMKEDVVNAYTQYQVKTRDLNNTDRRQGVIKDKQRWATMEELRTVIDMIDPKTFTGKQDRLILGLYLLLDGYVLRLDFSGAKIYRGKQGGDSDTNWLHVASKENYAFHLNDFKTKGKFEPQIIPITNEKLIGIIDDWLSVNKTDYLLVNYKTKNQPLSEQSLSNRIRAIFYTHIKKKIGNSDIRHIQESETINNPEYDKLNLDEKINLHKKLQHGFQVANEYRKR